MPFRPSDRRNGNTRTEPKPLDAAKLQALALRYVGRYATTRAKLLAYLQRKLVERGWGEEHPADLTAIVARFAELGYVDDEAFARMRGAALTRRGLGVRRVAVALRVAGVSEEDGSDARRTAEEDARGAALLLARRRRIGPFAVDAPDRPAREKAIATMVRGGHDFALAREIILMSLEEAERLIQDKF